MHAVIGSADLAAMGNERGEAIQRRIHALGISDREFHEQTGIDRKTLRRAIVGQENVRPSTYAAIESALDKLEAKVRPMTGIPSPTLGSDYIEFDISGDFGVHLIVKGPVADAEVLQRQVLAIIREIRKGDSEAQQDS